jgi:ATP-dependent Clp protease adapter protein ClpS
MDMTLQEVLLGIETTELRDTFNDSESHPDGGYSLILWNDDVNNMFDVVLALYEVCKLSHEKCLSAMMEAHTRGKALAKTGGLDEMLDMKTGLNRRGLEATVEENAER